MHVFCITYSKNALISFLSFRFWQVFGYPSFFIYIYCIYIYIHILHIYIFTHIYIHKHVYIHKHIYTYIHTHTHTHIYKSLLILYAINLSCFVVFFLRRKAHDHCKHIYTHTYIYTLTHIYTHARTHAHTRTHI